MSSPAAGTTLNASPERITVGTTLSCSGPWGSWRAATALAVCASASSALRPWSGALPECEARPVASTLQGAGGLAPHHDALLAVVVRARRPRSTGRRRSRQSGGAWTNGPVRHSSSVTSSTASSANVSGRRGQRAGDAERQDVAALHVGGAGAVQPVAVAAQRLMGVVTDHGVDVAEQHHLPGAGARHRAHQVGALTRRRGALRAVAPRRPAGSSAHAHRQRPLGAVDVARRRGDVDQLLRARRRPDAAISVGLGGDRPDRWSRSCRHRQNVVGGQLARGRGPSRAAPAASAHRPSLIGVGTPCRRPSRTISPLR